MQWLASRRLDRIENRLLREVDAVTVCSEQDAVDLRSRSAGGARVLAAPNAIAVPAQMPARPQPGDGEAHSLLFVGAMSYAPNEDAVLFLVEEVWPLLRERFSGGLQLQVVGPDPSPRVRNAAEGAGVTVTGRVEKVAPYFRAAEVLLCPIRYGGGTRIKLLEAFANGVPVVSTSIGAEGLEARHDEQLLIADTAPAFAAACERILSDAPLADRLRASAFELVQRHYSAEVVQERLAEAVQDLLP